MAIKFWKQLFRIKERDMLRLYTDIYNKNIDELTRWDINMFKWEGLPCPQATAEIYLLQDGYFGNVIDAKQGNIITKGGMSGVTNYANVFTQFTYATPLTSGMFTIDGNGVICKANSLATPDLDCVDLYAHLLTHVDLSIQATLINMRANNAFTAENESQKQTITTWLRDLRKGKPNVIVNKNVLNTVLDGTGISTLPTYQYGRNELPELYMLRQNLLRDYFNERGFVSDKAKEERLVTAELSINIYRTIFSISDMLEEREEFCDRARKVLGLKYSVEYNKNIKDQIDAMLKGGMGNAETQDTGGTPAIDSE